MKAAVLPEPVCAQAMMSRPAIEIGTAYCWTCGRGAGNDRRHGVYQQAEPQAEPRATARFGPGSGWSSH